MDEIDHLQDLEAAAIEARTKERLKLAAAEAATPVPDSRECADCGCDIPRKRLEARPNTIYCVDCQADAEKRTRH